MIKPLKVFGLLLIVMHSNAQQIKELGIGLLEVNTDHDVTLFNHYKDSTPTHAIKCKPMKNGQVVFESALDLAPYAMYEGDEEGGYPKLQFIVTKETPLYFKVIVNAASGEQYYIKKNEKAAYYQTQQELTDSKSERKPYVAQWYIFETWCRYLKRVAYIELNTIEIYDKPHGKKIIVSNPRGFFPFTVEEVKGEWIKLKKLPLPAANFKADINYEGWYQWKKNNQLQIQIVENTYE